MSIRCKLGIHARYEKPQPRLLMPREMWCRLCLARWSVVTFTVGDEVVRGTERLPDRSTIAS